MWKGPKLLENSEGKPTNACIQQKYYIVFLQQNRLQQIAVWQSTIDEVACESLADVSPRDFYRNTEI